MLREKPVFFVDRCLGKIKVASLLRAAGAKVEVHDDHFPPNAPDEVWMRRAGKEGWLVLTRGEWIRRRPRERALLWELRLKVFMPEFRKGTADDWALCFTKSLVKMVQLSTTTDGPFIAKATKAGRLRLLRMKQA